MTPGIYPWPLVFISSNKFALYRIITSYYQPKVSYFLPSGFFWFAGLVP